MRTAHKHHSLAVAVASTVVLPPSPGRRGLHISPPSAGTVSITFGEIAVANTGYTITTGTSGIIRLCSHMGDDHIKGSMNVIGTGAAVLPVTEIYEYDESTGKAVKP